MHIKELNIDLFQHLLTYLSFLDIYNFCTSIDKNRFEKTKDFIYTNILPLLIQKKLENLLGKDYTTTFLQVLRQENAIISVSFLLQGLINKEWSDSDIEWKKKII